MFNKVDIRRIVRDHYSTLYDNRSGGRWVDYLLFLVVPAGVSGAIAGLGGRLRDTGPLLAGIAVFAGLMFALLIVLLQIAFDLGARSESEGTSDRLLDRVRMLRQVVPNVAYSVLISVGATVILAVGQFTLPDRQLPTDPAPVQPLWFSLIATAGLAHLLLTLLMVLKRTYTVLQRELDFTSVSEHN
jgi:hypothetical protein